MGTRRRSLVIDIALLVLLALPVLGFITCSQVLRYRREKMVEWVGEFIASARAGDDRCLELLARGDDEAKLQAARTSNGGRIYLDVYPGEDSTQRRVYVNDATPPWERCGECHSKR